MSNRFGLEELCECANCGAETFGESALALCDECADGTYRAAERELDPESFEELPF